MYIAHGKDNILTIEKTASLLGISSATVRNWVKCGYLKMLDNGSRNLFHLSEIENIKTNIENGNLEKLNKRANKSKADRTFIPEEYLQDESGLEDLNNTADFIKNNNIDLSFALLLLCLNLLVKERLLTPTTISDIEQRKDLASPKKQLKDEINSWLSSTETANIRKEYSYLLNCPIPKHRDILGFVYQSLLLEGKKSQSGSYYTPSKIVDEIVNEYVKKDSKVFDPCCGTGQFLLSFARIINNPANIYGVDTDEIAVKIARINMLIQYKDKEFTPNILCVNTLFDVGSYDLFSLNNKNIKDFDVIATNPPWGLHFSEDDIKRLKKEYPQLASSESFSYFLSKSIDLLKTGGILSFILPEAVLNVKTHKDIRNFILKNTRINKIVYLDRIFKNVFTPVIRLDVKKHLEDCGGVIIQKNNRSYSVEQSRWESNQDNIFDIHASGFDAAIIDKIYDTPHTTLENQADWALGIVTGNNAKYITNAPREGYEEVYKGKDVTKFILKIPSSYIQFKPDKFQQVAPTDKYRAKVKLIYRFISKNLIFAYDDKQKLTLNSANIVIPRVSGYPIEVILALFNSSLYQFIFQKKFSSIKVLRSHIEQLPLPLWHKGTLDNITDLVNEILKNESTFESLDNFIMDKYALSEKENNYIKEFNK